MSLLTGNKTASAEVRGDDFFEPGKLPARQVPIRWVSWKTACRQYPETLYDVPPTAVQTYPLFAEAPA